MKNVEKNFAVSLGLYLLQIVKQFYLAASN